MRRRRPGAKRPPPAPAPRWPDGRVSFTGTPTDVGNWEGPANASIFFDFMEGKKVTPQASLPTNKTVDEIPFKPGFKETVPEPREPGGRSAHALQALGRLALLAHAVRHRDRRSAGDERSDLPRRRRASQLAHRLHGRSRASRRT